MIRLLVVLVIVPTVVLLTLLGCMDNRSTSPLPTSTSAPPTLFISCPAGLPGVPESASNSSAPKATKQLKIFRPREGDFSILMPHAPEIAGAESLPTAYGPLDFRKFSVRTNEDYYEVGFGDVPGTGPIVLADWLNFSSNARLQGSTLIERHDVTLDGIPGKAYTAAGSRYWSERIYFVGRRFYRITVYFPRSRCTWPPDAAAFLNSFHSTHARR
jgi:hypothetical protein